MTDNETSVGCGYRWPTNADPDSTHPEGRHVCKKTVIVSIDEIVGAPREPMAFSAKCDGHECFCGATP